MRTLVASCYRYHLSFVLGETVINEFGSAHETGVTRANLRHSIFFSKVVVDL